MRKVFVATCLALTMTLAASLAQAGNMAPLTLADITLGQSVETIKDRLDPATDMALWDRPFINRVKLTKTRGYKSGYVEYGTCKNKNKILRIKMKYADDSIDFFADLLQSLSKAYGKPVEWRGNPTGTVKSYKWTIPGENERVSLVVQRSVSDDENYTKGNSIRISLPLAIRAEAGCKLDKKKSKPFGPAKPSMNWFLPQ